MFGCTAQITNIAEWVMLTNRFGFSALLESKESRHYGFCSHFEILLAGIMFRRVIAKKRMTYFLLDGE